MGNKIKKIKKVIDYRPTLTVLAIALMISVGAWALAQTFGNQVNVDGDYNDYRTSESSEFSESSELEFGSFIASASRFTDVDVTNDLVVEGGFGIGTIVSAGGNLTDGYFEKVVTLTITNTSSAGILNPEGETIFVYDATFRYQTATSSAVRVTMGTSTQAFIVPEESALDFPSVSGGDQSIFASDTNFPANAGLNDNRATSTIFRADNLGKDTRDSSGTQNVIPVLSTEFLTCYASTTEDLSGANPAMGTFQGQCQIKYWVIED